MTSKTGALQAVFEKMRLIIFHWTEVVLTCGSVHLDLDLQVEQVLREVDGAPNCPATKGEDAAAGLDAPVEESEGDIGRCGETWGDMGRCGEPG